MYWERIEEQIGRFSIVGSLHKKGTLPQHLAADEKITFWNGQETYVALTCGEDCVWGIDMSMSEDKEGLEQSYNVFKTESLDCQADYQPKSINLDGWKATNAAWKSLFPSLVIILCFLHEYLKIRDMSKSLKEKFSQICDEIWKVYQAQTKEDFLSALPILKTWAKANIPADHKVIQKIEDMSDKSARFEQAYEMSNCYRTSNQVDRPMNRLDRYLYQCQYFHGNYQTANLKLRAWAIIHNFKPFCKRVKHRKKQSRFEEHNGFCYHQDWLQNLLIAGSLNGYRNCHKKK